MSIYAVGDIQGCYDALCNGLEKIKFDPACDQLWCVGDLVNRGGQSVNTLKLLYSIRDSLKVVLGNHDLYLLKTIYGNNQQAPNKDIKKVVQHTDAELWCNWLRGCPLYHYSKQHNCLLVHAGLPHIWTLKQAMQYGDESSKVIADPNNAAFWNNLFGDKPKSLKPKHHGIQRQRVIINYFTRMRFISPSGKLNLKHSDKPSSKTLIHNKLEYLPWYAFSREDTPNLRIIFGHWAALNGILHGGSAVDAVALDTGCVWGGKLSFYDITRDKITYQSS